MRLPDEDEIELSPCGLMQVEWHINDGLMSHVIRSPRLIEVETGRTILSLQDGMWDGQIEWLGEGRMTMYVRHYSRGASLAVAIDLPARTFRLGEIGEPKFADEPLDRIDASFRREFDKRAAAVARPTRPTMPPTPAEKRRRVIENVATILFLILTGAAIAIWLSERG